MLLSLETIIMGVLMYNITLLTELNYILMLIFAVTSSVIGLIMLINMMTQYGREFVKF